MEELPGKQCVELRKIVKLKPYGVNERRADIKLLQQCTVRRTDRNGLHRILNYFTCCKSVFFVKS
jgi:hypothetical protein